MRSSSPPGPDGILLIQFTRGRTRTPAGETHQPHPQYSGKERMDLAVLSFASEREDTTTYNIPDALP